MEHAAAIEELKRRLASAEADLATIRESEARYRTVFNSIEDGYAIFEVIRGQSGRVDDVRFLQTSPAHDRQTGLTNVIGKRVLELFPDYERHWLDVYDAVATSGEPQRVENYAEGLGRWYDVQFSAIGGPGTSLVATVYKDISAQKRAELALRESEERQAFLLKLSDTVRPLADAAEIQGETARLLREQLIASWCYHVDWDPDRKVGLVLRDSASEGLPSLAGVHDVSDAPEFLQLLTAGGVLTVRDYASYEHLSTRIRQTFAALGFRSMMAAPLVKEGRLVASLLVGDTEMRDWSASEASLLVEVAERTWAAVERARAEKARRLAEERLLAASEAARVQITATLESIGDAFYAVDTDFRLTYVNTKAEAMWRRSRETLIGRNLWAEFPEAIGGEPHAQHLVAMRERRLIQFEGLSPVLGRWMEASLYPDPASGGLACYFRDITERKRAEALLRDREERQAFALRLSDAMRALETQEDIGALAMRMIAEQLKVDRCWVCRFSQKQGLAWLGPEYCLPGLPAMSGEYRLQDFPETMRQVETASPAVADVRNDPNLTELDRASILGIGMGAYMTTVLRRGEQEYVWALCASTSEPRNWTEHDRLLLDEVTERVWAAMQRARAAAALRDSEERFQQFATASAAGLWIRDAETLAMEFASPAIATIYGVDASALLGDVTRWAAMIVPDDRVVALDHVEAARRGQTVVHEFRIQRPSDGAFRWIRNADFPLRDNGSIPRIGGIAEDVTEAKLAAEHSAVLLAELQHRVRNIMALLRSITNRTAERAESVTEYRDLMMGRLLAFSRVQTLLTRAANVRVGISSIVRDEVSVQAQHEDQYLLDGPDVALSPKAAEVLTLAIHELTTNAVKYGALSAPTGRVTVRWSTFERRGGPWLAFDWTEDGAPARPAPTSSEPSRRRGFGSELIEARIPYELRGRGQVTIEPGGARCHLEFPLEEGASILETGAPPKAVVFGGVIDMTGEPDLTGRRVLVVEDDFYLATDAARALRGAGAEVMDPCATEEDARAALAEQRPDAVVVDINLGPGPSFKLAETLRDSRIPFVFTTGYDPEVIPAEFESVVRLEKPLQLRKIVGAVAKLTAAM